MEQEDIYCIALSRIPGVGTISARRLLTLAGSATSFFEDLTGWLRKGVINQTMVDAIRQIDFFDGPRELYNKTIDLGIEIISYGNEKYPYRLRECIDAPLVLFYKGNTNLNAKRVLSIVGTRHITNYGKEICKELLNGIAVADPEVLIISGLAYGVDITAHRESLNNGLETIGVLAHGLDTIYPQRHRSEAVQMVHQGGLITEFPIGSFPDRKNFVCRNRIIAGMSDATLVVESAIKGGSLITAGLANDYDRDCFAFPGSVFSKYSQGCNQLIKDNKAQVVESSTDVLQFLGWDISMGTKKKTAIQKELFGTLTAQEQTVIDLLQNRGDLQIDNLAVMSEIPISKLHTTLFELEMKGILKAMVGGSYHLV